MTDADVDGSHIRTLLLTFFFRQMQELVLCGNLYIAQPPLYRAKKGKKTVYLKDDKALTDYLFAEEASGLRVVPQGAEGPLEETSVLALLGAIRAQIEMLDKVARRSDRRVVRAFLDAHDGDPTAFRDATRADLLRLQTKAGLEGAHDAADLRLTRMELVRDEAFDAWEIHVRTRDGGIDRETVIGWEFANSAEYRELRRRKAAVEAIGAAPFRILRDQGEPLAFAGADDLYNHVDAASRKGYDIQRYKGLGEMNPEQLWETTMDPTRRTLVQVKVDDLVDADEVFTVLMGDEVEQRRNFIETNALNVRNLDI
jgi:DNA gyrase subunit B